MCYAFGFWLVGVSRQQSVSSLASKQSFLSKGGSPACGGTAIDKKVKSALFKHSLKLHAYSRFITPLFIDLTIIFRQCKQHANQKPKHFRKDPKRMRKELKRAFTVSEFQDGKPSSDDNNHLLYSLSLIARGHQRELHLEKSMNNVRCSLGLYNNHPLAQTILLGAPKRTAAFKTSGAKQLNHVRGTDGWWRTIMMIEVRFFQLVQLPSYDRFPAEPYCFICF